MSNKYLIIQWQKSPQHAYFVRIARDIEQATKYIKTMVRPGSKLEQKKSPFGFQMIVRDNKWPDPAPTIFLVQEIKEGTQLTDELIWMLEEDNNRGPASLADSTLDCEGN